MMSPRRIHCWIVTVQTSAAPTERTRDDAERTVDPYICGLIARLQAEVRDDRKRLAPTEGIWNDRCRFEPLPRWATAEHADAEITWHDWPLDFSEPDFDAWERSSIPPGSRWNLPR
jgi:hypothetical protein